MQSNISFALQSLGVALITFFAVSWYLSDGRVNTVTTAQPLKPQFRSAEHRQAERRSRIGGNKVSVDDIHQEKLVLEAYTIISHSKTYEKRECSASTRRYLIGRIYVFVKRQYRHPHIDLPSDGKITQRKLEGAINSLFLDSLLTLDEFPAPTRKWLEEFAQPGSKEKAEYIKECQSKS